MTKFNIVQKFPNPNHSILYLDPFTGKLFEGTKLEDQKVVFLLSDQQEEVFEIREDK